MRAVLAAMALLLVPATGVASPLEDTTVGGAVFTGPTHPYSTALHINPAAMGLGGRAAHVFVMGSARLDQFDITPRKISPAGETSELPSIAPTTLSPGGSAGIIWGVGENVTIGATFSLPMTEEWIEGQDALAYHVLGGHHRQWATSLGFSFRATSRFFFGASLSLMVSTMRWEFARDTALEAGSGADRGITSNCAGQMCGFENPSATQLYDVSLATPGPIAGGNIAAGLGAVIVLREGWLLGVSYQSPPGLLAPLRLRGTVRVQAAPRDGFVSRTGDAELEYELPQTFHVGLRGRVFADYDLIVHGRVQNLSRQRDLDLRMFGRGLEDIDVPEWYPRYRGLDDVVTLEAGLEQSENAVVRLGGRLRFETAAVNDAELSPLQVATTNLGAGAGVALRLGPYAVISGSYGFTYHLDVDTGDSAFDPLARLDCVDNDFDLERCTAAREGRAVPTAAGRYGRLGHAFRAGMRFSF